MEQAEVADCLKALGQDVLEAPAETLRGVEVGGAGAGPAHLPRGARDHAVLQADETVVGDGDVADIRGEGGEGGVAVVVRLTVDMPGDGPDLGSALLQQTGVAHRIFAERTGDGRERLDRDKKGGAGGPPRGAVLGEAPARDARVDMGVILQWSAPGVQAPGKPWQVGPEEAVVGGQALESRGRRLQQGLIRTALRGAEEGSQRLRDGAGEEEVRPRQLLGHVVVEPLRRCMLLTLRAMTMATGMLDAVWLAPAVAWGEALAVVAAWARLDGADDLAVGEG
jgi:hypothetical protein